MKGRIVSVGHVTIRTKDMKRAVNFYRETVGLKHVVDEGEYFNAFEVGDVHFCIMPGEPQGKVHFDFASDDVDALHKRLIQAGVSCKAPSDDPQSGHRWFSFTDPDEYQITVNSAHKPFPEINELRVKVG